MSQNSYQVLIYPSAENDLIEIKEYFLYKLKISPNNLFEKFYKLIDTLEKNPHLFPLLKDPFLNQLGYRMIPIDNFLLFYIIDNETVQIHRFLYGRRNYLSIL
jgi:addiction module RelE/StbE family toxin